jgi:hypothetical protein
MRALPGFDRRLLRMVERVVPCGERAEWARTWQAELWYLHECGRGRTVGVADLSVGLVCDALWLRSDDWRRRLDGTPALCLGAVVGLCLMAALIGWAVSGDWRALGVYLGGELKRSVFEAPLVVFVAFATASRRHLEQNLGLKKLYWMKRQMFFGAKIALVLVLAFLLSADICGPFRRVLSTPADLSQIFFFVLLALVGLRWAFRDQEERCKQCLHSLATPARVGRPSHNLLEWNGTELICKHGHGLLSIPEMETSWCEQSQWIDLEPGWDQVASA